MKQKYRYLLIESSLEIEDRHRFTSRLFNELINIIGLNYYKVNPKIVSFIDQNKFIIKGSNSNINFLILAFTFIKELDNNPIYFYTLKSSGTIKSIKEQIF